MLAGRQPDADIIPAPDRISATPPGALIDPPTDRNRGFIGLLLICNKYTDQPDVNMVDNQSVTAAAGSTQEAWTPGWPIMGALADHRNGNVSRHGKFNTSIFVHCSIPTHNVLLRYDKINP